MAQIFPESSAGRSGKFAFLRLFGIGGYDIIIQKNRSASWYQGLHGDMYAKAMRELMIENGMKSAKPERVE